MPLDRTDAGEGVVQMDLPGWRTRAHKFESEVAKAVIGQERVVHHRRGRPRSAVHHAVTDGLGTGGLHAGEGSVQAIETARPGGIGAEVELGIGDRLQDAVLEHGQLQRARTRVGDEDPHRLRRLRSTSPTR